MEKSEINTTREKKVTKPKIPTPDKNDLIETITNYRGNKTAVANHYGVSRPVLKRWLEEVPEAANWVVHQVGARLDGYLDRAHIVAMGIPMKDGDGKIIGWETPPDTAMLRFLIEKYGNQEGFGNEIKSEVKIVGAGGVPVAKWLSFASSCSATEETDK